jgi:hypothetical protein
MMSPVRIFSIHEWSMAKATTLKRYIGAHKEFDIIGINIWR